MIRQSARTVELPPSAFVFRVSEQGSAKLDEQLVVQVIGEVRVAHGELVACHVTDIDRPVHDVGILAGAEDIETLVAALGRHNKEVTDGNILVFCYDTQLCGIAFRENTELLAKHIDNFFHAEPSLFMPRQDTGVYEIFAL